MLHLLTDNPFAAGLIATALLAAVLAYLRNVPRQILNFTKGQFTVSVVIKSTDPVFQWLTLWLNGLPYSNKARRLAASLDYGNRGDERPPIFEDDIVIKKTRPHVLFTPAIGQHLFWYKNNLVWLSREGANSSQPGAEFISDREKFVITVLSRKQDTIRSIINDARDLAVPPDDNFTYVIASGEGRWLAGIKKKPRLSTSVILPGNTMSDIIRDARRFITSRAWYDKLGIPYRRGYLLWGKPGSGKTSAVLAVAGELAMDVYFLNLGDKYLDDSRVSYLLSQIPGNNIVLLEDVDAVFDLSNQSNDENHGSESSSEQQQNSGHARAIKSSSVTFSGLLNALDGVASTDGRLLFMTTNFKEKLDPALIRAGRTDLHIEFDNATQKQAECLFLRFFPENIDITELAIKFGEVTPDRQVPMGAIQDHLLMHKDNAYAALAGWERRHNDPRKPNLL